MKIEELEEQAKRMQKELNWLKLQIKRYIEAERISNFLHHINNEEEKDNDD